MKKLATLFVMLTLLSDSTYAARCVNDDDHMPSWEMTTLLEELGDFFSPNKILELHILSWHTEADDRPLKIDNLLLWSKWTTDKGELKWFIVSAFRWPEDKYYRKWTLPSISHSAYQPYMELYREPTEADVLRFLAEHRKYHNKSPVKFKLLEGEVQRNTWKCLFGTSPPTNVTIESTYESY